MVIYNEEKLLERALESIYDLVDEIILIHDGKCTDGSLEIAKKYTEKIYILPHVGVAESHRPFAYRKTKNNWILQIDADEYLSKKLRDNLPKLIDKNSDIYEFAWPILRKGKLYYGLYKIALFKKDKVYLLGAVHEYPKPIEKKSKIENIKFPIIHEPNYENSSFSIFITKWIKWAKLQARQYSDDFKIIQKWNYKGKTWDYPTSLRIKYPILYGMILTPFYHLILGLSNMFKYKSVYSLKQEFYTSLYFFVVFYNFKFKNENK